MAVEPGQDFARGGMIERGIARAQRRPPFTQTIQPAVLEREQVAAHPLSQRIAQREAGGTPESSAIFVGIALGVALDEGQQRHPAEQRLRGGVDRVPRDLAGDLCGPAGEAAQMKVLRHPAAVVDRIIVPERRLAPQLPPDAGKMAGGELARAYLLAGPEDADRRIEQPAELFEIEWRPLSERQIEDRIVRIIRRAAIDSLGDAAPGSEMDDRRLPLGQIGDVAAHVVEQQSEIVGLQLGELGQLGGERRLPAALRVEVKLERAEADSEAHADGAAGLAQARELGQLGLRIRLLPAAAQPGIRLGRIEEEEVAVRPEETNRLAALG